MRTVLRGFLTIGAVSILIVFQGCATMDQSECQTANWEIVGLEDGSAGRATSYLGEHRSACAEYRISPDLDAYLKGHARGVSQYCNYDRGYSTAIRGGQPNSICGRSQHQPYFAGIEYGREAYQYVRQINDLENSAFAGMDSRLACKLIHTYRKEGRRINCCWKRQQSK